MPTVFEETPARVSSLPAWISADTRRLLASLSLEEKIGQMHLMALSKENFDEAVSLAAQGRLGAYLCYDLKDIPPERHHEIMQASLSSRAGIPVLHGRDVIHGHWTSFPIGPGMAASFDPALVESLHETIASEATRENVFWTFAPMMDIARDPRWGRVAEGFGEDPWLAARMAEAAVWGLQGRSPAQLAETGRMLACAKHFIGYGAAEGGRDADTCEISRHTLLNIYFPPFLAAFRAGAGSVMSGYHDLNGEPVSASRDLLAGLAKNDGELRGFIVSDYGTNRQLPKYRFAEDPRHAAEIAALAGLDMDMASDSFAAHLADLVREGRVPEARIDDAVARILEMKRRLDLRHRLRTRPVDRAAVRLTEETRRQAIEAAVKASVLLQNRDQILPLPPSAKKLFVAGPLVTSLAGLHGPWALDPLDHLARPLLDCLREQLPDVEIKAAADSPFMEPAFKEASDSGFDTVLYVGGEGPDRSGERHNLAFLNLPAGQEEQILNFARLGKKVVLVLFAGRPLNLSRLLPHVAAVLYVFHPGTAGFEGVARILAGAEEPKGRLPLTFPRAEGQIPLFYNSINKRPARPTHLRYLDISETPLFPFGHGLGYTAFAVSDVEVARPLVRRGESALVSAEVKNTGARDGETVVQCYLRDCVSSLLRPTRELKGFKRVRLRAGQSARVEFALGDAELGFFDRDAVWTVEPGRFEVFVGLDSDAEARAEFTLTEEE